MTQKECPDCDELALLFWCVQRETSKIRELRLLCGEKEQIHKNEKVFFERMKRRRQVLMSEMGLKRLRKLDETVMVEFLFFLVMILLYVISSVQHSFWRSVVALDIDEHGLFIRSLVGFLCGVFFVVFFFWIHFVSPGVYVWSEAYCSRSTHLGATRGVYLLYN